MELTDAAKSTFAEWGRQGGKKGTGGGFATPGYAKSMALMNSGRKVAKLHQDIEPPCCCDDCVKYRKGERMMRKAKEKRGVKDGKL